MLCLTYDALGVKLTGMLEVCDGCARSKEKSGAIRKKTYTRVKNPGETIFVDTPGPSPENLIGNCYWIGKVDY